MGACIVSAALTLLTVPVAQAGTNTAPSTALSLGLGVPMGNQWLGTPRPPTNGIFVYHWYRPDFPIRSGDIAQIAFDATGTTRSGTLDAYTSFCWVPPVDDFGAADAVNCESGDGFSGGTKTRFRLPYSLGTPNGYLILRGRFNFDAPYGTYAFTVERVQRAINIGAVAPSTVKREFTFRATARYGDNSPVSDGLATTLQWKRVGSTGVGPRAFASLASGRTANGTIVLPARLPNTQSRALVKRRKSILIRACVNPGEGNAPVCTRAFKVRVRR